MSQGRVGRADGEECHRRRGKEGRKEGRREREKREKEKEKGGMR